jgi:hypothetical protein
MPGVCSDAARSFPFVYVTPYTERNSRSPCRRRPRYGALTRHGRSLFACGWNYWKGQGVPQDRDCSLDMKRPRQLFRHQGLATSSLRVCRLSLNGSLNVTPFELPPQPSAFVFKAADPRLRALGNLTPGYYAEQRHKEAPRDGASQLGDCPVLGVRSRPSLPPEVSEPGFRAGNRSLRGWLPSVGSSAIGGGPLGSRRSPLGDGQVCPRPCPSLSRRRGR